MPVLLRQGQIRPAAHRKFVRVVLLRDAMRQQQHVLDWRRYSGFLRSVDITKYYEEADAAIETDELVVEGPQEIMHEAVQPGISFSSLAIL